MAPTLPVQPSPTQSDLVRPLRHICGKNAFHKCHKAYPPLPHCGNALRLAARFCYALPAADLHSPPPRLGSLMKYWGMPREASLGPAVAGRERRASPLWGCKERATLPDGPRWPRPSGCAAFWGCAVLLPGHGPIKGMLPRRALLSPKKSTQRGMPQYFNRLPV